MRYRRADVAGGSYFFTLVTENRRPLFEERAAVALFLGAVEKVRARHPFEVDAYVVFPITCMLSGPCPWGTPTSPLAGV
jgi:putative transposase